MSRPVCRRLRVVRYHAVVLLIALSGSPLFAQSSPPGVPVEGLKYIDGCSHDGFEAFGRDAFSAGVFNLGDLRYWQYDTSTGIGKTTNFPVPEELPTTESYSSYLFPKDGIGLLYLVTAGGLYAWNVDDGFVARIEDELLDEGVALCCCSDDGSVVYATHEFVEDFSVRQELLRIEKSGDSYAVEALRVADSFRATACSSDGYSIFVTTDDYDGASGITTYYVRSYQDGAPLWSNATIGSSSSGTSPSGLACSPGGEWAVVPVRSVDGFHLSYFNADLGRIDYALEKDFLPAGYETRMVGSGSYRSVDDDGIVYGYDSEGQHPDVELLPAYFDPAVGAVTRLPILAGYQRSLDLVSASPGAGTFVYSCYGPYSTYVRYSTASGTIEDLKDVLHVSTVSVAAASRDASRLYAKFWPEDYYRFIVEPPADETPPTVESATIGADGRTLSIVFSETVTDVLPPTLDFTRGPVTATYESGNGTTVLRYALARTLEKDEEGNYELASGAVQDAAGNANESASGPVLNRSKFIFDPKPPKAVSARINAAGDTLTIVFSENVVHRRHPKLELSGGRVVARYESGTGSRAISYDLSRTVRKGEVGKCSLVAGAVVDAAKNRIEAVTRRLENRSKSRDDDGSRRKIKSDRRPSGTSANDYCDAAYQQASGIVSEPGGYTAYGYAAFACVYNSALYRYECGERIRYGDEIGLTRDEALAIYKSDRYLQRLYAYYAQMYAYEEYCRTSSTSSLYACLFAAYSSAYGAEDLIAK